MGEPSKDKLRISPYRVVPRSPFAPEARGLLSFYESGEIRVEASPRTTGASLVPSCSLKLHGKRFAGQMAEWVVETAFIGAQRMMNIAPLAGSLWESWA